jgi:lysosomal acid lipase/cholesteryl ester hydrolase
MNSWDQMGNYDIPANINYILSVTKQPKIIYIGHSLGSAIFFIAMIKHPELNDKIDVMFVSIRFVK